MEEVHGERMNPEVLKAAGVDENEMDGDTSGLAKDSLNMDSHGKNEKSSSDESGSSDDDSDDSDESGSSEEDPFVAPVEKTVLPPHMQRKNRLHFAS